MVYKALWRNMLPIKLGTPWGEHPSIFDKYTGFFYMHFTTQGTNSFASHPKGAAIMAFERPLREVLLCLLEKVNLV